MLTYLEFDEMTKVARDRANKILCFINTPWKATLFQCLTLIVFGICSFPALYFIGNLNKKEAGSTSLEIVILQRVILISSDLSVVLTCEHGICERQVYACSLTS